MCLSQKCLFFSVVVGRGLKSPVENFLKKKSTGLANPDIYNFVVNAKHPMGRMPPSRWEEIAPKGTMNLNE